MSRTTRVGLLASLALAGAVYVGFDGPGRTARLADTLADGRAANSDFFQNWGGVVDFAAGDSPYRPLARDFDRFRPRLGPVYGPGENSPSSGLPGVHEGTVLTVNAHPPFATLLCLPLAGQTYAAAFQLFAAAGLVFLAAAAVLLVTCGGPDFPPLAVRAGLFVPFAVFVAASAPLHGQFAYGNWNALLLLLLTAGWRLSAAGRFGVAGAAVGAAALIKIYPALVALAFFPRGRRTGLVGFACAILAGLALTLAIFGVGEHVRYVREVLPVIKMQTSVLNVSVPATAGRLFDPSQPFVVPLVRSRGLLVLFAAAWGAALLAAPAWRVLRGRPIDADGLYAALVAASVVLSPVAYGHNLLLLALPAWVVLVRSVGRSDPVAPVLLTAVGCVAWLSVGDLHAIAYPGGKTGPFLPWESLTVLAAHTYAATAVCALACRLALADPADGGSGRAAA